MVWRVSVVGAPEYRANEPGWSVHKHHPIVRDLVHLRGATQGNRSVIMSWRFIIPPRFTPSTHQGRDFQPSSRFKHRLHAASTPPSRLDEGGHHRRHRAGETPSLRRQRCEAALSLSVGRNQRTLTILFADADPPAVYNWIVIRQTIVSYFQLRPYRDPQQHLCKKQGFSGSRGVLVRLELLHTQC